VAVSVSPIATAARRITGDQESRSEPGRLAAALPRSPRHTLSTISQEIRRSGGQEVTTLITMTLLLCGKDSREQQRRCEDPDFPPGLLIF
jgi:hypothetical protein